MQAYLAEKQAQLAQYLTIQLTEYCKAQKQKTLQPKVLKEQAFYIPKEQHDLDSNIISNKANQTSEEIIVQLDNEDRKEEDEYNRLEVEFNANGQRHTENRRKEIQARLREEHARESERYILQNTLLLCSYVEHASIAS